jgi:hypothetical protein
MAGRGVEANLVTLPGWAQIGQASDRNVLRYLRQSLWTNEKSYLGMRACTPAKDSHLHQECGQNLFCAPLMQVQREFFMPKGEQRSNRETRKPKADKKLVALEKSTPILKQMTVASPPKKKG